MLAVRARVGGLALCLLAGANAGCTGQSAAQPSFGEQAARELLVPTRFAWLSSERETAGLPSAIALGAQGGGRTLLYFEFPAPKQQRPLSQALLLLRPVGVSSAPVPVELWRADAARAELRAWGEQPRALYPRVTAKLGPGGPESLLAEAPLLRVDVTSIVRAAASPSEPLRLLLRAEPGDGEGVLIATGAFGAEAPRLELYFE